MRKRVGLIAAVLLVAGAAVLISTLSPGESAIQASAAALGSAAQPSGCEALFETTAQTGRGVCAEASFTGDVRNYGGYFVAAGGQGRGVYGRASNSDSEINYGGFFYAAGVQGRGVFGQSAGSNGMGVKGWASDEGYNVENYGGHFTAAGGRGIGVFGFGALQGGHFESTGSVGNAVHAVASGSTSTGVYGESSGPGGTCYGGFFRTFSPAISSTGVYGDALADGDDVENHGGRFGAMGGKGRGVSGYATNEGDVTNYGGYFVAMGSEGRGVYGEAAGMNGYGGYFVATTKISLPGRAFRTNTGTGLYAKGGSNGYAADFQGNVILRSWSSGSTIMELGEGLDYAEGFDVSDGNEIVPGSVLIIDPDNPGKLTISDQAYDTKVAGIVAGANGQGSGIRLGVDQFDYDVALAGRVYCNVDATEAGVEPGDLLTTSATPGYAMKATDYDRAQGAILGKAMERLEQGERGQILVLVTLQ